MSLPYYKKYPRDFFEGTINLSFEAKGAYGMIIDLIFIRDGRLEDDAHYIAGVLGCSVRKWKSIREELMEKDKIKIFGGIISNFRANFELEKTAKYRDNQREKRLEFLKNNTLQNRSPNQREREREREREEDADDVRVGIVLDNLGWPIEKMEWLEKFADAVKCDERTYKTWRSHHGNAQVIALWRTWEFPWDVITEVSAVIFARKRDGPPRSIAYFTDPIKQAVADRQAELTLPPPRQPHDPTHDRTEPGAGRSTAYMQRAIEAITQRRNSGTGNGGG